MAYLVCYRMDGSEVVASVPEFPGVEGRGNSTDEAFDALSAQTEPLIIAAS